MLEVINPRVKYTFDNFIDRAAAVNDEESEYIFNDSLDNYVSDIECDLGTQLTELDCKILYDTFGYLKEIASTWRQ